MFHCCAYCSINMSVGNTDEISLHGQNPTVHCVLNPNNEAQCCPMKSLGLGRRIHNTGE